VKSSLVVQHNNTQLVLEFEFSASNNTTFNGLRRTRHSKGRNREEPTHGMESWLPTDRDGGGVTTASTLDCTIVTTASFIALVPVPSYPTPDRVRGGPQVLPAQRASVLLHQPGLKTLDMEGVSTGKKSNPISLFGFFDANRTRLSTLGELRPAQPPHLLSR